MHGKDNGNNGTGDHKETKCLTVLTSLDLELLLLQAMPEPLVWELNHLLLYVCLLSALVPLNAGLVCGVS